jgi:DNA recombination protein RmuC
LITILLMETILFLSVGLIVGALSAWFIAKFKFAAESQKVSTAELEEKYVLKEVFENLQKQTDLQKDDLKEKEQELRTISNQLSAKEQDNQNLHKKLSDQKEELNHMQQRFQTEFENIANRLLEEKSKKFTKQNKKQLDDILSPLREKIKDFEDGIDKKFHQETIDRISLKKEIEQLRDLNLQLSQDANNLVNALKGDSKSQGDWGEFQLEMLLKKAGLVKEIHYQTQSSFKDDEGKDKRPDFIINLPEGKHLVIDSKVSLTAYEKFFNEADENKRKKHLKAHTDSLKNHVKDLSGKKYQNIYQINSPDYLLLFVPIEPAFSLAIQNDSKLFLDALEKNIVIVCPSTLLATLRTVSYIWKQDKQKRSVLEIARQSGLLYDKFCNFVEDLKAIGSRLDSAQDSYHDAMNKLTESKRRGDTLIGRAEKIKSLGAKTSKSLPKEMVELVAEKGEEV